MKLLVRTTYLGKVVESKFVSGQCDFKAHSHLLSRIFSFHFKAGEKSKINLEDGHL